MPKTKQSSTYMPYKKERLIIICDEGVFSFSENHDVKKIIYSILRFQHKDPLSRMKFNREMSAGLRLIDSEFDDGV